MLFLKKFYKNNLIIICLFFIFYSCSIKPNISDSCDSEFYDISNNFLISFIAQQHPVVDLLVKNKRKANNVFTGDSLIALWVNATEDPFGGYMWNDFTNLTHVNSAIAGNTTCDLIKRVNRHITSFEPKFIFTDGGGNDLLYEVPQDIVKINIINYLEYIRLLNSEALLVYMAIPPTRSKYLNLNKKIINDDVKDFLSLMGNSCIINMNDFLAINGIEGYPIKSHLTIDGVHWNDIVYQELKRRTENAFRRINDIGVQCFSLN